MTASKTTPTNEIHANAAFVVLHQPASGHAGQDFTSLLDEEVLQDLGTIDKSWFTKSRGQFTNRTSSHQTQKDLTSPRKRHLAKNIESLAALRPISPLSQCFKDQHHDNITDECALLKTPVIEINDTQRTPLVFGFSPMSQNNVRHCHSTPASLALSLGATMGGQDLSWSSSMATPVSGNLAGSTPENDSLLEENNSDPNKTNLVDSFGAENKLQWDSLEESSALLWESGIEGRDVPDSCSFLCQSVKSSANQGTVISKVVENPAPDPCCNCEGTPKLSKKGARIPKRNFLLDLQDGEIAEATDCPKLTLKEDGGQGLGSSYLFTQSQNDSKLTIDTETRFGEEDLEENQNKYQDKNLQKSPRVPDLNELETFPDADTSEPVTIIIPDCSDCDSLAANQDCPKNSVLKQGISAENLEDETVNCTGSNYNLDSLENKKEYMLLENMVSPEPCLRSPFLPLPTLNELASISLVQFPLGPCAVEVNDESMSSPASEDLGTEEQVTTSVAPLSPPPEMYPKTGCDQIVNSRDGTFRHENCKPEGSDSTIKDKNIKLKTVPKNSTLSDFESETASPGEGKLNGDTEIGSSILVTFPARFEDGKPASNWQVTNIDSKRRNSESDEEGPTEVENNFISCPKNGSEIQCGSKSDPLELDSDNEELFLNIPSPDHKEGKSLCKSPVGAKLMSTDDGPDLEMCKNGHELIEGTKMPAQACYGEETSAIYDKNQGCNQNLERGTENSGKDVQELVTSNGENSGDPKLNENWNRSSVHDTILIDTVQICSNGFLEPENCEIVRNVEANESRDSAKDLAKLPSLPVVSGRSEICERNSCHKKAATCNGFLTGNRNEIPVLDDKCESRSCAKIPCGGFTMASGKAVSTSAALLNAKRIFGEEDIQELMKLPSLSMASGGPDSMSIEGKSRIESIPVCNSFTSAKKCLQNVAQVSSADEAAAAHSSVDLSSVAARDGNRSASAVPSISGGFKGFQLANGKAVPFSKAALKLAQSMFKDDDLSDLWQDSRPEDVQDTSTDKSACVPALQKNVYLENNSEVEQECESWLDSDFHEDDEHGIAPPIAGKLTTDKFSTSTEVDSPIAAGGPYPQFSWANGKTVSMSKAALDKAKKLFAEDDLHQISEVQISRKSSTSTEVDSPIVAGAVLPNGPYPLFTFASGKAVSVSKALMEKAKSIFAEEDLLQISEIRPLHASDGPGDGRGDCARGSPFLTASQKVVPVFKSALQRVRASSDSGSTNEDVLDRISGAGDFWSGATQEDGHRKVNSDGPTGESRNREHCQGFLTVSQKIVPVSENALKQVRNNLDSGARCNGSAKNSGVKRSSDADTEEEYVKRLKLDTEDRPAEQFPSSCGFSSASGKPVAVSEMALAAVRMGCSPEPDPQVVPSSQTGSQKSQNCSRYEWDSFPEEFSHNMSEEIILAELGQAPAVPEIEPNLNVEPVEDGQAERSNEQMAAEVLESTVAFLVDDKTPPRGKGSKRSTVWISPIKTRPNKHLASAGGVSRCIIPSQEQESSLLQNGSSPEDSENHLPMLTKTVPLDVQHLRQLAVEGQLMRIAKRKRSKVLPVPGILWQKKQSREHRVSLCRAVNGKCPKRLDQNECLRLGIKMSTLKVTCSNAEEYQFLWEEHYDDSRLRNVEVNIGSGCRLIFDAKNMAGKMEFYRSFLDSPGVDSHLIDQKWVFNHYRWIVWKLAAMEVSFPEIFGGRLLTPNEVMLQLNYRYNCEIDFSRRSALKRIVERDDTPAKTLVLCVVSIDEQLLSNNEESSIMDSTSMSNVLNVDKLIEVTDGWYSIKAAVDKALHRLIKSGQICVGQKIVVHGAELIGPSEPCPPLEASSNLALKLSANCCRRARWHTPLGYLPCPKPFPLPLMSLFADGGMVGCIHLLVARVYPTQYLEKLDDGISTIYNDRTNNVAALQFESRKSMVMERIVGEVQRKFDLESSRGNLSKHSFRNLNFREEIKELVSGAEIYEAIENCHDPALIEDLSNTQLNSLAAYKDNLLEGQRTKFEAEIQRALNSQNEKCSVARNVVPFLKIRAVGTSPKDLVNSASCLITIWNPSPDVESLLKEGKAIRAYYLMAEARSYGLMRGRELQLKSTKRTKFEELILLNDAVPRALVQRKLTVLQNIGTAGFSPPFGEIDIVGLIVHVGQQEQGQFDFVYMADPCANVAVIKFWGGIKAFGLENLLQTGTSILATNLQWRGKVASSSLNYLYASELSTFSQHPKDPNYKTALSQFENSFTNVAAFVEKAKAQISSLTKNGGAFQRGRNLSTSLPLTIGRPACTSTPIAKYRMAMATTSPDIVNQRLQKLGKYGTPPPLPNLVARNSSFLRSRFQSPKVVQKL